MDCSGTTRKWALGLTTAASVAQSDLVAGERLANVAGEQSDEFAALDKMVKDGGCDKIKDYMGDFVSVIKFVYMATSDEGKLARQTRRARGVSAATDVYTTFCAVTQSQTV